MSETIWPSNTLHLYKQNMASRQINNQNYYVECSQLTPICQVDPAILINFQF